jgi:two-component system, NtrC family, nitrogen regulation sensor histidine kinase NtrY
MANLFLGLSSRQPLVDWARRVGLGNKLTAALTIVVLVSVMITYMAMTGTAPFSRDDVLVLLNVNLILVLVLGIVVVRRLVELWGGRRRGLAGSRLHVRLVVLFGLVAAAPAVVVAVFSALFINLTVEGWFSQGVRTAVESSLAVAQSYLEEHRQAIRADALAMANDLNNNAVDLMASTALLDKFVDDQSLLRSFSEAMVFNTNGGILARSGFYLSLEFEPIPIEAMTKARDGAVVILPSANYDRVRALLRLDRFANTYLYVGRPVDPMVIAHVEETGRAVADYKQVEAQRSGLQITFALAYVVVALLLLLAATWIGLLIATKLARPIAALIDTAERVRSGDLSARVSEAPTNDELGTLSRAFNRMTSQLEAQRAELVEANRQLERRRRFTETVLSGVSAGVIGLDQEGRISLPNSVGNDLLSSKLEEHIGEPLAAIVPELTELIEQAIRRPDRRNEAQIRLKRGRNTRLLLTRVTAERVEEQVRGFVVTLDDVTELVTAQRTAAWADVARRIAHEIKNPLTPIQLSAERLKRKYLKEITSDPETFVTCTDTIVRQVGDIGRMVDEFSAFARMPAPVMKQEDLRELCREAIFLLRNANAEISFTLEMPERPAPAWCDARLVRQALINLLQNAVDAINERLQSVDGNLPAGQVWVRLRAGERHAIIEVEDNGKGLPSEERDRLTEPYMTTRSKGTGLGLAIVKKIMEDHGGELILEDGSLGGARVSLSLPQYPPSAADESPPTKVVVHGS